MTKLPSDPPYNPLAHTGWTREDATLLNQQGLFMLYVNGAPVKIFTINNRSMTSGMEKLEKLAADGVPVAKKALELVLRDQFLEKCGVHRWRPGTPEQDAGFLIRDPRTGMFCWENTDEGAWERVQQLLCAEGSVQFSFGPEFIATTIELADPSPVGGSDRVPDQAPWGKLVPMARQWRSAGDVAPDQHRGSREAVPRYRVLASDTRAGSGSPVPAHDGKLPRKPHRTR